MSKQGTVCALLSKMGVRDDVRGSECTSFRIGGRLGLFVEPTCADDIAAALSAAQDNDYPVFVMGNGSNMLIPDEGVDALFIRIGEKLSGFRFAGSTLVANAGTLLSSAAKASVRQGLTGLEWAAGIPGTIGGGIAMNAGAYGGDMRQTLLTVTALRGGKVVELTVNESDMGYRRSTFAYPGMIVISATMQLAPDDGRARSRMEDFAGRRREKQPINLPSAGSTFKRPEGYFAGALIEGAGLKGMSVGGACVSPKHAGFIVNNGGATYDDVITLIDAVRKQVYAKYGVMLEPEVKIIS